jgi:hypothetical protein
MKAHGFDSDRACQKGFSQAYDREMTANARRIQEEPRDYTRLVHLWSIGCSRKMKRWIPWKGFDSVQQASDIEYKGKGMKGRIKKEKHHVFYPYRVEFSTTT